MSTDQRYCPHCNSDLRGEPIPPEHFLHNVPSNPNWNLDKSASCEKQKDDNNEFDLRMGRPPEDRCNCLSYGDLPPEQRFYSRLIGVEQQGIYDGVLYWMCPDCGGKWHRWTNAPDMMAKAQPYIDGKVSVD